MKHIALAYLKFISSSDKDMGLFLPMPRWPLAVVLSLALAENCLELSPSTAAVNYRNIRMCLEAGGTAVLAPGTFLLPHGIKMPENSTLIGTPGTPSLSRLMLAVPSAVTRSVLEISSDSQVSSLILDAGGNQRDATCCRSVMNFVGNNSQVTEVEVTGSTGIGILFENPTSRNNVVVKARVHHCYYGVAFSAGLRANQENSIEQSIVEDISCDAISFVGYGQVRSTTIRNIGASCGPPSFSAGAGFFCKGNRNGALIESSVVSNTCGMSLDVDSCSYLEVRNNTFRNSGYDFGSNYTHCWGMPTAILLDSQMCSVTYNSMENMRSSNKISLGPQDPHQVYSQVAAALFSDLPEGNDTIINFGLLHRPSFMAMPSIKNEIANNSFSSRCDELNCSGVAYFVGRGTGLEGKKAAGHEWGERIPEEPSEFTGNMVSAESDVGSVRCGVNRYAPTASVCPEVSDFPCNEDDYSHPLGNFRNDDCRDYISDVHALQKPKAGLRHPLPLGAKRPVAEAAVATGPALSRPEGEDWIDSGSQAFGMSFHFG